MPHPRQTSPWLLPLPKEIMRACKERCLKRQKTDLVWFFVPWTINIWISRVEEFQGYWFSTPHCEITVTLSGSSFAYNWLRFLSWHKVFARVIDRGNLEVFSAHKMGNITVHLFLSHFPVSLWKAIRIVSRIRKKDLSLVKK